MTIVLSPRENQVVELLLMGKSNKQIALSLGISERTVEFHLKNIYIKMQVTSRVELILNLDKRTGEISGNLVESTVVLGDEKLDNDSQYARMRAAQSWRNLVSLIRKEAAMTIKISFEDLETYLKNHPILFSLLVLSVTGLVLRVILFHLGLYFWGSYLLLEVLLVLGSLRFGELLKYKKPFHPLLIVFTALSIPIAAWGFDQIYLLIVLPYIGVATISIPAIHAAAEWLISAEGTPCLSTNLSITSNAPLYIAMAEMLMVFLLSRTFGKPAGGQFATA